MKTNFMKTAILTALLLTGIFAVNAGPNNGIQKNTKERVRLEIARSIPCPDFIEENSITNRVKVIVQVDETGQVKVAEINSANPKLQAYVLDRLQNMKIKSPGEKQKFVLLINFNVAD